jgi:hypothetical protein
MKEKSHFPLFSLMEMEVGMNRLGNYSCGAHMNVFCGVLWCNFQILPLFMCFICIFSCSRFLLNCHDYNLYFSLSIGSV